MKRLQAVSRRSFLGLMGIAPLAVGATSIFGRKHLPVGLELYSVRDELAKDLMGTLSAVAKIGYEVVEFFAPYFQWSSDYARDVRKRLDGLGLRCLSTHNPIDAFSEDGLGKAIELNHVLGSRYVVLASAGNVTTLEGWKGVADRLGAAAARLGPEGLRPGYHNHQLEFTPLSGKRPIEVLAEGTPKEVCLQLDVGTCLEAGSDPVEWIKSNPGRIKSIHCKDWAPGQDKGYRVLFGEGAAPWRKIIKAAESRGGVEYYLIEQEGSRYSSLETASRCFENWKKLRI